MHKGKAVLIVSYETQRLYSKLFENHLKNTNSSSSSHNINSSKQKKRTTTTTTTTTTTITTKSSNDEIVADDLNKADGIHKGDDHITITNKSNDDNGDDGDSGDNNQHNDGVDHDDHCAYYKELLQFHSNNSVCDLLICDEVR